MRVHVSCVYFRPFCQQIECLAPFFSHTQSETHTHTHRENTHNPKFPYSLPSSELFFLLPSTVDFLIDFTTSIVVSIPDMAEGITSPSPSYSPSHSWLSLQCVPSRGLCGLSPIIHPCFICPLTVVVSSLTITSTTCSCCSHLARNEWQFKLYKWNSCCP